MRLAAAWSIQLLAACLACAACYREAPPAAPVPADPPLVVADPRIGCVKAALGIENGTRALRPPEAKISDDLQQRCIADRWPADALTCFATMEEGDLARCAGELPEEQRERMFAIVGGDDGPRATIAIAQIKLSRLRVGVTECDDFIQTVSRVLGCEAMPLDDRVALGSETADFWSLPTSGLPADAERRMAAVCAKSLTSLQQRAVGAGCMP